MPLFKKNARDQGATSFVRMDIPPMIFRILGELAELHPEVVSALRRTATSITCAETHSSEALP